MFPHHSNYLFEGYSNITVDENLTILNHFVQSARNQGAKEYKASLLKQLQLNSQNSQASQLNFQPYNKHEIS